MFYVMEISRYVDGSPTSKGIYTYDNEIDAMATFHSKLGGAMKNSNYAFELVHVVNDYGVVIASEYFERPVPEPEPEPEEDPEVEHEEE